MTRRERRRRGLINGGRVREELDKGGLTRRITGHFCKPANYMLSLVEKVAAVGVEIHEIDFI